MWNIPIKNESLTNNFMQKHIFVKWLEVVIRKLISQTSLILNPQVRKKQKNVHVMMALRQLYFPFILKQLFV